MTYLNTNRFFIYISSCHSILQVNYYCILSIYLLIYLSFKYLLVMYNQITITIIPFLNLLLSNVYISFHILIQLLVPLTVS